MVKEVKKSSIKRTKKEKLKRKRTKKTKHRVRNNKTKRKNITKGKTKRNNKIKKSKSKRMRGGVMNNTERFELLRQMGVKHGVNRGYLYTPVEIPLEDVNDPSKYRDPRLRTLTAPWETSNETQLGELITLNENQEIIVEMEPNKWNECVIVSVNKTLLSRKYKSHTVKFVMNVYNENLYEQHPQEGSVGMGLLALQDGTTDIKLKEYTAKLAGEGKRWKFKVGGNELTRVEPPVEHQMLENHALRFGTTGRRGFMVQRVEGGAGGLSLEDSDKTRTPFRGYSEVLRRESNRVDPPYDGTQNRRERYDQGREALTSTEGSGDTEYDSEYDSE